MPPPPNPLKCHDMSKSTMLKKGANRLRGCQPTSINLNTLQGTTVTYPTVYGKETENHLKSARTVSGIVI